MGWQDAPVVGEGSAPAWASAPLVDAPAPPQQGGTNTVHDSRRRGLPTLTMPNALGFERPALFKHAPAPSISQQLSDVTESALGIPTGIVGGLAGIPGDVEGVGRLLLSPFGASKETGLP